jgi:hypothetical protein
MLNIVNVEPLDDYKLHLVFANGESGIVDLQTIPRTGVFEAWNDLSFFKQVSIHPEFGTVTWPGDLDLDPYALYAAMTQQPIDTVLALD